MQSVDHVRISLPRTTANRAFTFSRFGCGRGRGRGCGSKIIRPQDRRSIEMQKHVECKKATDCSIYLHRPKSPPIESDKLEDSYHET